MSNSCSPFKVVTVDSLLSSATQDVAPHDVIIRSCTSALCSILIAIHRLNFTWLLTGTKPLRHWWTEQIRSRNQKINGILGIVRRIGVILRLYHRLQPDLLLLSPNAISLFHPFAAPKEVLLT